MDTVEEWACKIAEVSAYDEVDLAPFIVEAFISGGQEKEALFHQSKGGVLGAFDPASIGVGILQWVFEAMSHAAPVLYHILGAATVHVALYLNDRLSHKQELQPLPEDTYIQIKKFTESVTDKLQPLDLSTEQCELIAYRVLQVLLENPSSAKIFIKKLESSSHE